jgi:hypothetical protein
MSTIWFHLPSGQDLLLKATRDDAIRISREYDTVAGGKWNLDVLSWAEGKPLPDEGLWVFERPGLKVVIGEVGFEPRKDEYMTISEINYSQVNNLLKFGIGCL